ncbi:M23 family metallopeptidase [Candidatus Cyanaurora vandensis]|uniref:M23 family metallopeptidase n=1 Tax=Candidatus Cyanaurora vandensis TaxID=2714958 RepID=UPI00257AA548|nr:M23 family metallopeptidase [Candidatus Cyanaurora vandensis]
MLARLVCCWLLLALPVAAGVKDQDPDPWQKLSFPVDSFKRISSAFGWRSNATTNKGTEFHSGLDLAAPQGAYIRAWADGLVQKVAYDPRCGWQVSVDSKPWTHTYCHISAVAVKVGDVVRAGQVIAAVGATGRATGPHLHWTLRYNGELVDPYQVLLQMQQAWQKK